MGLSLGRGQLGGMMTELSCSPVKLEPTARHPKDSRDEKQSCFEQETASPQRKRGSSYICFSGSNYKRSML